MNVLTDQTYWIGVATVPAIWITYRVAVWVVFAICRSARKRGIFIDYAPVPEPKDTPRVTITIKKITPGVRVGHYRDSFRNMRSDYVMIGRLGFGYKQPLTTETKDN